MLTLGNSKFGVWDWSVLAVYFAALISTGVYFAWRAKRLSGARAFYIGDGTMPVWAVAISIVATSQSAATFTGVPEQGYTSDFRYLATNIGGLIAGLVLAMVFIPAYYRRRVTTPYQLLEGRFGVGAKLATSWAYMVGRVFSSGARVYVGAIPVSLAVFGDISPTHLAISIIAFMAFGIVYTLAGGITSVIWTDVLQVSVYLGAAVAAAVWLIARIDAPMSEVFQALRSGMPDGSSKLGFISWKFAPESSMNIWTICTGFVLLTLATHGTDQDLVQRLLTCTSGRRGSWSVVWGILVGIPTVALFLLLGQLMWIFYQRPELMGTAERTLPPGIASSEVFLHFILTQMPTGFAGLMIAGVLAAGPAGINSSLNSMASTFVNDVFRTRYPSLPDRRYIIVGRWATVVWGVVLGAFALTCIHWQASSGQDIINFVLSVMNFAYAGLLGVFITALFTRRGTVSSVIAAMATGFVVVLLLRPEVWSWWTSLNPWTSAHLMPIKLAWPWHLVIGSLAATVVCVSQPGRPTPIPSPQRE